VPEEAKAGKTTNVNAGKTTARYFDHHYDNPEEAAGYVESVRRYESEK
jgi:hypothetical protein